MDSAFLSTRHELAGAGNAVGAPLAFGASVWRNPTGSRITSGFTNSSPLPTPDTWMGSKPLKFSSQPDGISDIRSG